MNKNIILMSLLMMVFVVGFVSAEETAITNSTFTHTTLELVTSFSAMIGVIFFIAIVLFFLNGGSDTTNPWGVLLLGLIVLLIMTILGGVLVETIVDTIYK